jgi:glycosyltransferase involved in cell wall biosynthesis
MHILYLANARIPTEKAHGLQIMQNCEALADGGARVTLWTAARRNTPALRAVSDPFAHYGVKANFRIRRLPCLDLLPLVPDRSDGLARAIFWLQLATFTLAALIGAIFTRADAIYSRDAFVIAILGAFFPRRKLGYEAHSWHGGALERRAIRRATRSGGAIFTTTRQLADTIIAAGAEKTRVHVAPDGIRAARFADLPDRETARRAVGWRRDAFIVGYVGRLHTMGVDKGVGTVVDAIAAPEAFTLALVGGPDDMAAALREQWRARGGSDAAFLYAGQVPAADVPLYLRAFDVCVLPLPYTEHFAHYASPMKLFEYMAAGRAIVASDLPSTREIVTDGDTALLYPPDDGAALRRALDRLRVDPVLRGELAAHGRALAFERYTWDARARQIINVLSHG